MTVILKDSAFSTSTFTFVTKIVVFSGSVLPKSMFKSEITATEATAPIIAATINPMMNFCFGIPITFLDLLKPFPSLDFN